MLRNYLKITFRNFLRNKIYSGINLLGLSMGLACAILLYLYVQDELSYDAFYKNYHRIYRISAHFKFNQKDDYPAATPGPLAEVMKKDYPEVEQSVRLFPTFVAKSLIHYLPANKKISQRELAYADENYFKVFENTFIAGDSKNPLKKPYSIVLTESLAKKIFASPQEAIGKALRINEQEKSFQVTAVVNDLPKNTNFNYSGLLSISTFPKDTQFLNSWGNINLYTFVLLKKGADATSLDRKMKLIFKKYGARELQGIDIQADFSLQALKDVHLKSNKLNYDFPGRSDWSYVYIFSAIAVFVLLIACINYMNLATARSVGRAKEVGIRKVLGSYRKQLMGQFLTESIFFGILALTLALLAIELVLPFFNNLSGKAVAMNYFSNPLLLGVLLIMVLLVGFVSGTYPAFFLSSFKPVLVLKGKFTRHKQSAALRRMLVVLQFAISITMIIGTWLVYQQLKFVNNKNLGFAKEQVVVLELEGETIQKYKLMKDKLREIPSVKKVASSNASPGNQEFSVQGMMIEQEGQLKEWLVRTMVIDYDFLEVMGIPLKKGRNFSRKVPGDTTKAVLVNETLTKKLAWKDNQPIGKKFLNMSDLDSIAQLKNIGKLPTAKIVGVFGDFHLTSLHQPIEPMALFLSRDRGFYTPNRIFIRLENTQHLPATMEKIREVYEKFDQKRPFESYFLDQNFARQYEADNKRMTIFFTFSILTIFIACLGLFGLASFTAEQRTKEIGIRKVLGASIPSLLYLVTKDFLRLVLLANLFAFPAAALLMNDWLRSFAYRTSLMENWYIFLYSAFVALTIAIVTVSYQALRASTVNPVKVLKDE